MGELLAVVSSAELSLWLDYYQSTGFAADRIEAAVAISGAVGKRGVRPQDLIPVFRRGGSTPAEIMAFFERHGKAPDNGQ